MELSEFPKLYELGEKIIQKWMTRNPKYKAWLQGLSWGKIEEKWREWQKEQSASILLFGTRPYVDRADFSNMFIPVELLSRDIPLRDADISIHQPPEDEPCEPARKRKGVEAWEAITRAFSRRRHVFVLGPAAMGKTTLLKFLINKVLQEKTQTALPIFIPLFSWFSDCRRAFLDHDGDLRTNQRTQLENCLSLDGFVRWISKRICRVVLPGGRDLCEEEGRWELVRDLLMDLLAQREPEGVIWWFLDGLDEIPRTWKGVRARSVIAKALYGEMDPSLAFYKGSRLVITSRVPGPIWKPAKFQIMRLLPFSPKRAQDYMERWFKAAGGPSPSRREISRIWQTINQHPGLKGLACRPLFPALICAFYAHEYQREPRGVNLERILRQTREEIYRESLNALLESWERVRREGYGENGGIRGDIRSFALYKITKQDLFRGIAFYMFEQGPIWLIPEDELKAWITAFFKKESQRTDVQTILEYLRATHENRPAVANDGIFSHMATEFLARQQENYGIIVPRNEDFFGFAHRSFQEFYAADYILHRQAWLYIERHLFDEFWGEVIFIVLRLASPQLLKEAIRPALWAALRTKQRVGYLGWVMRWLKYQVKQYQQRNKKLPNLTTVLHWLSHFWERERDHWEIAAQLAEKLAELAGQVKENPEIMNETWQHIGAWGEVLHYLVGHDLWPLTEMDDIEEMLEISISESAEYDEEDMRFLQDTWGKMESLFEQIGFQAQEMEMRAKELGSALLAGWREEIHHARRASPHELPKAEIFQRWKEFASEIRRQLTSPTLTYEQALQAKRQLRDILVDLRARPDIPQDLEEAITFFRVLRDIIWEALWERPQTKHLALNWIEALLLPTE